MAKLLENSLLAQKAERDLLLSQPSVPRLISDQVKGALSSSLVKVITGPRRAGKSTLAFQALKGENFGYINFEDDSFPEAPDTNELLARVDDIYGKPTYLFLDEIQVLPKWEQFVNKLHRNKRNVVLTGSNSRLLAGELASSLTGRHLSFELLPFSFAELCASPDPMYLRTPAGYDAEATDALRTTRLLEHYWERGGFPDVAIGSENPRTYLTSLTDSIILKDIVRRYRLRNPRAVSSLINQLLQEPATRFSANSLRRSAPEPKPSVTTIQNYLKMAHEAYLIYELQPFSTKSRVRLKADRKLYIVDHALARSHGFLLSEKRGALLENLVFIELVRRGFAPNERLFYYQTRRGEEVDFLLTPPKGEPELLQVCFELSALKTLERELSGLTDAAKDIGTSRLTIVTYNERQTYEWKGSKITAIPLAEWLLRV